MPIRACEALPFLIRSLRSGNFISIRFHDDIIYLPLRKLPEIRLKASGIDDVNSFHEISARVRHRYDYRGTLLLALGVSQYLTPRCLKCHWLGR